MIKEYVLSLIGDDWISYKSLEKIWFRSSELGREELVRVLKELVDERTIQMRRYRGSQLYRKNNFIPLDRFISQDSWHHATTAVVDEDHVQHIQYTFPKMIPIDEPEGGDSGTADSDLAGLFQILKKILNENPNEKSTSMKIQDRKSLNCNSLLELKIQDLDTAGFHLSDVGRARARSLLREGLATNSLKYINSPEAVIACLLLSMEIHHNMTPKLFLQYSTGTLTTKRYYKIKQLMRENKVVSDEENKKMGEKNNNMFQLLTFLNNVLHIPQQYLLSICECYDSIPIPSGDKKIGHLAAIVYYIMRLVHRDKITQAEIANMFSTSEVNLRNQLKKYRPVFEEIIHGREI